MRRAILPQSDVGKTKEEIRGNVDNPASKIIDASETFEKKRLDPQRRSAGRDFCDFEERDDATGRSPIL
jgi:hypothetical protein